MEKKEVQQKITEKKENNEKVSEEEFYSIIRLVSPGTNLRAALEGILNAGKGALIVVENEELPPLIDGGFKVNSKFSPQKLIELSKMDGAMILSKDMKKINQVNVQLNPNIKLKTNETGTRHKAAERTARHISGFVIAISERRKEITIYYKNKKHVLRNTAELLRKTSENIQILEKQRELFDNYLTHLNKLEIRGYISLNQAIKIIQKGKVIQKIYEDIKKNLIELGTEGMLIKTRIKEILTDVEKETNLIIKDYANMNYRKSVMILDFLSYEDLLDKEKILGALDYEGKFVSPYLKGWRIFSKTSLTEPEIAMLIKEMERFDKITSSELKDYIGEEKSNLIKAELEKIKLEY